MRVPTRDAASEALPNVGGDPTDGGPVDSARPDTDVRDAAVGGPSAEAGNDAGFADTTHRVVAYLPNYSGNFRDWAKKIDFSKMTHLNLAFATANRSNDWDIGATDADVKALVDAAHAAGIKVLLSLGGGGGDQTVIAQFRDAGNIDPLVEKLDKFVTAHNFDGADVDIEDPNNLGNNYSTFIDKMVVKLRPRAKLVTAAVAQYLQDKMSDATLHQFDFVNVMVYSSYAESVNALNYYAGTKGVPRIKLTLGAGFFGTDDTSTEYGYADLLKADATAWDRDVTEVNGKTVRYTGMASMKKLAEYSKGFGGIMFWELSLDSNDGHSLYRVIQDSM
jgi:chitinase